MRKHACLVAVVTFMVGLTAPSLAQTGGARDPFNPQGTQGVGGEPAPAPAPQPVPPGDAGTRQQPAPRSEVLSNTGLDVTGWLVTAYALIVVGAAAVAVSEGRARAGSLGLQLYAGGTLPAAAAPKRMRATRPPPVPPPAPLIVDRPVAAAPARTQGLRTEPARTHGPERARPSRARADVAASVHADVSVVADRPRATVSTTPRRASDSIFWRLRAFAEDADPSGQPIHRRPVPSSSDPRSRF